MVTQTSWFEEFPEFRPVSYLTPAEEARFFEKKFRKHIRTSSDLNNLPTAPERLSIRYTTSNKGHTHLHNTSDHINDHYGELEKVLVSYHINGSRNPLFTVDDLFRDNLFTKESSRLIGVIAERIAHRSVKYFLNHLDIKGKTGPLFDEQFNPRERDGFIVGSSQNYVLKVDQHPNLIILKRDEEGKFGFTPMKGELDGLFLYRKWMGKSWRQRMVVLETKTGGISVQEERLAQNHMRAMQEIFPGTPISYMLCVPHKQLFNDDYSACRRIKTIPQRIYQSFKEMGIDVIFRTLDESPSGLQTIANHLVATRDAYFHKSAFFTGHAIMNDEEIKFYNGSNEACVYLKSEGEGLFRVIRGPYDRPST